MKLMKTALQTMILLLLTFSVIAQSNITLQINHLLEGEPFELEMDSKNDLENDFMIDRLEYYLSTFSIIHDGGQVTNIGYRFIALEGLSGPNVDQELQFHCIGDEFYEEMSFPVSMSGEDSYIVEIDAEYTNLLSEIDVSNGLILHGNLNEIQTLANNLKSKVFTSAEVTSVEDNDLVKSFKVYPNPVVDGWLNIEVDAAGSNNVVRVIDSMGKIISNTSTESQKIQITNSGIYLVSVLNQQGKTLSTKKVIVQ